jgi:hypothetical protein
MNLIASIVVVAFGLLLAAFTGVAIAKPTLARRFLMGFASSARIHFAEQIGRLVVGAALILAAPTMWQAKLFWLIGWAIVVSSAVLICLPWRWHHRFGERVRPMFSRYMWLYVAGAFLFGLLLLYGVLADGRVA